MKSVLDRRNGPRKSIVCVYPLGTGQHAISSEKDLT